MRQSRFLSQTEVDNYDRDGYVLLQGAFSQCEVNAMIAAIEGGGSLEKHARVRTDAEGKKTRLAIWHTLTDDIWGTASTAPSLVNNVRIWLRQEIAFFHGKVMLKEAHTGGAWEWHQDYGYWYDQGFVFPRMISAWVALDPATRANGCLEVLRGSHKLGRLTHTTYQSQTGADPKRLAQVKPYFEHVHCEMRPGSVLFFDCNLLHGSGANLSAQHRRAFIVCYNALTNPYLHPGSIADPRPCPVSADDEILRRARAAVGAT